jgi:hypothetical protein
MIGGVVAQGDLLSVVLAFNFEARPGGNFCSRELSATVLAELSEVIGPFAWTAIGMKSPNRACRSVQTAAELFSDRKGREQKAKRPGLKRRWSLYPDLQSLQETAITQPILDR